MLMAVLKGDGGEYGLINAGCSDILAVDEAVMVLAQYRNLKRAVAAQKFERGHLITTTAKNQWCAIVDKNASPTGLPAAIRKVNDEWVSHLNSVRAHR